MISMAGSHACLLSYQSGHHFKFFTVDVSIAVKVEHAEGNLKMTTGNWETQDTFTDLLLEY